MLESFRVFSIPATVCTRICQKDKIWEVRKTTNGVWIQVKLTLTETLSIWLSRTSLLVLVRRGSGFVVVIADLTILCLATPGSASLAIDGPKMKNSTTLGFLFMLRMKTTRNTSSSWNSTTPSVVGLRDPMCYYVLFANASESEVLLCLELVEGWQECLLMIKSQVVDTVVLLVYWNRRLSCRRCFHIVVAVGKVHHDWCQSWRCSRSTWPTLQSNRVPIETLGILRRSAIGQV